MSVTQQSTQHINVALKLTGVSFSYTDGARIVDNFSLEVERAQIVSILGASGCGKTTLLSLISGLLEPDAGRITVDGGTNAARVGYIFQHDALLPWRTVKKNLALACELGRLSRDAFNRLLDDYLSSFHLDESVLGAYPAQLSGGMRQRVSVIQTLLFDPQIILLDEPFSALDFSTKLCLESEFVNFCQNQAKTAIVVTHDIEEAIAISDRVILLAPGGKIEADIPISFGTNSREPETVRGLPEFGDYYRIVWGRLKTVIGR